MDDPALNGLQSEAGGAEKEGRQGLEGREWGPERETMRSESGRPKETGPDEGMSRCREEEARRGKVLGDTRKRGVRQNEDGGDTRETGPAR